MKTKLMTIISVVAMSGLALILSNTAMCQVASANQVGSQGAGGALVATPITPEEAAKKYPAPKGKYPLGERDPHKGSGLISSPYPPHQVFDCSNIAHGGLVLDTHTKKVFVRP